MNNSVPPELVKKIIEMWLAGEKPDYISMKTKLGYLTVLRIIKIAIEIKGE